MPLVRREVQRLVRFLHPDARLLGTMIDCCHNHDTGTSTTRRCRAVDMMAVDKTPLTAGPPVCIELAEWISSVLLLMFFPLRIVHPDAVCRLVLLLLQSAEEF